MSNAAEAKTPATGEKPNPPLASFNWQDPCCSTRSSPKRNGWSGTVREPMRRKS